jgi:hypothetical protein
MDRLKKRQTESAIRLNGALEERVEWAGSGSRLPLRSAEAPRLGNLDAVRSARPW